MPIDRARFSSSRIAWIERSRALFSNWLTNSTASPATTNNPVVVTRRGVLPRTGASTGAARAICARCPVRKECAAAGAGEHHGIWGGKSGNQRRQARNTAT